MSCREKIVLVSVLKTREDFDSLLKNKQYRIPLKYLPSKKFDYIAFYETKRVNKVGKIIRYYGDIGERKILKRIQILPFEKKHPCAHEKYLLLKIKKLKKLKNPIVNFPPRRIVFGYTTLSKIFTSKNILELFNIPPTEEIVESFLRENKIKYYREFPLKINNCRFRLDFALFLKGRKIAIECDNKKSHSSKKQKIKDQNKDKYLKMDKWTVIRLKENEIFSSDQKYKNKIRKIIGYL